MEEVFVEVGTNEQDEVVINLPDNTGHIVFSPDQAWDLATSLQRQANIAYVNRCRKEERERCQAGIVGRTL